MSWLNCATWRFCMVATVVTASPSPPRRANGSTLPRRGIGSVGSLRSLTRSSCGSKLIRITVSLHASQAEPHTHCQQGGELLDRLFGEQIGVVGNGAQRVEHFDLGAMTRSQVFAQERHARTAAGEHDGIQLGRALAALQ